MSIFHRNLPNDVLFLMPVRLADEKLSKGKIRMLSCDAAGKVYAPIISRSVFELARDSAERMERSHKSFATLGLETTPGKFTPAVVEIGTGEVWALEHILEHALKYGRLPDILKKYLKPIIRQGEASRELVLSEQKKRQRRLRSEATPRVLNRLPYYSEDDIEISMPIYKAEYSYPLVVLKNLPSSEATLHNTKRLLILDSDGDLAIIKVPLKFMNKVEKGLEEHNKKNSGNSRVIISQHPRGLVANYMVISQAQRKALDTLTRYFEETGYGKQPISSVARTVLARARDRMSSLAQ
jgi:hypothetical protein